MAIRIAACLACLAACAPGERPRVFGDVQWTASVGEPHQLALAVTARGDIAVAGVREPGFVVGVEELSGSDGSPRWSLALEPVADASSSTMPHLATDAAGDVYVTGTYQGSVDFGGTIATSGFTAFIAKYTREGQLVWVRDLGPHSDACGGGIATDPAGRVYVAGDCEGPLALGTLQATCNGSFVASLDADGTPRWLRSYAGNPQTRISLVAAGGDRVVMTETLREPGNFGDVRAPASVVAASLTADGDLEWVDAIPGDEADGLAGAPDGSVVVTGEPATIVELDPSGSGSWQEPGAEDQLPAATVLPGGAIAVAGAHALEAYSRDGDPLEVRPYQLDGAPPGAAAAAVASTAAGAVVVAGTGADRGGFVRLLAPPR